MQRPVYKSYLNENEDKYYSAGDFLFLISYKKVYWKFFLILDLLNKDLAVGKTVPEYAGYEKEPKAYKGDYAKGGGYGDKVKNEAYNENKSYNKV